MADSELPVGSYHELLEPDGVTTCFGRVESNGWTIFMASLSLSAESAARRGFKLVRSLGAEHHLKEND